MKGWAAGAVIFLLIGISSVAQGADFNGDSRDDIAVFRPSTGMWAVRGVTREYFGGASDTPVAGDYDGDGRADLGIFRPSTGMWAVRSITRSYFGVSTDIPISGGGGGQRLYDYVVKKNNGGDLVRALESDSYRSVFIPIGSYSVSEVITVDHVQKIVGETQRGTVINFTAGSGGYLDIDEEYCKVEGIRFVLGGVAGNRGAVYVRSNYVTIRDCFSYASEGHGFQHAAGAYVSFIDCIASGSNNDGFRGLDPHNNSGRYLNCAVRACKGDGFEDCTNISNAYIDGYGTTSMGFRDCERISTSYVYGCTSRGFYGCDNVSACTADSINIGFDICYRLSACNAENCSTKYQDCFVSDDSTTKYSCN